MNRIETTRETVSRKFASRPLRAAVAVKIAFAIMAANVSFAAAKVVFHRTDAATPAVAASVSTVKPFILPLFEETEAPKSAPRIIAVASASTTCHEVVVSTDEGYGVRGSATRAVCHKAL